MYNRGQGHGLDTTIPLPKQHDVLCKQSSLCCRGKKKEGQDTLCIFPHHLFSNYLFIHE